MDKPKLMWSSSDWHLSATWTTGCSGVNKQMPCELDVIIFAARSVWRPGQVCQGLSKTTDESNSDCAVQDTETIAAVRAAHVSCHVCRNC